MIQCLEFGANREILLSHLFKHVVNWEICSFITAPCPSGQGEGLQNPFAAVRIRAAPQTE